jgi:Flp pilus assembly protein TadD
MNNDSTRLPKLHKALGTLCMLCLCGCGALLKDAAPRTLEPKEVSALRLQMAESLVQQRDFDLALPYVRDLLARDPRSGRLHLLLGIVLREKGIYGPAQEELQRALTLDEKSSAAHAALASLYGRTHRLGDAEKHLRRAIVLAPQHGPHHNDLGVCLLLQRRYADARRTLQEAIRLDPGLRVAFNNLGLTYAMEGDDEGMRRAFQQGGSRAMALTNMGFVEELRGRPVAARHYYEQALRAQRGYAPALRNLRGLDPTVRDAAGDPEESSAGEETTR